jgi:hypothetical protein
MFMVERFPRPPVARRSFLTGLGAAAALIGVNGAPTSAATLQSGNWQPARHAQDDWFESLPGEHRFFLDALTPTGAGEAISFTNNYFMASQSGYGLEPKDQAVVVCLRHFATPFAFADPLWAKYAAEIGSELKFDDPKTKQPPTTNVYRSSAYGEALPNMGATLDDLIKQGVHFAVCDMATHYFAGLLAKAKGGSADDYYKEMVASAIPNCHFVAAGIVAVNRAQERGYSYAYVG